MTYALMTTRQLQDEITKLQCKIIELRVKMDEPCSNRDWLSMDATIAIYQEGIQEISHELEVADLI